MDTFTHATMVAIIPSLGSIESIGSAADNWSRTSDDEEEFLRYSNTSHLVSICSRHPYPPLPPLIIIPG